MSEITQQLEQRIRSALDLSDKPTHSGFHYALCPHCGDKQWGRAGFKFEGDTIVYNCFRSSCDATCVFKEGEYVSKKFRRLMDEIGVDIPTKALFQNKKAGEKFRSNLNRDLYEPVTLKDVPFKEIRGDPLCVTDIVDWTGYQGISCCEYLMKRNIKSFNNFYIPTISNPVYNYDIGVACWFGDKMIGFIYHSHTHYNHKPKYKIDKNSSDGLLYLPYGYIPNEPILVEGVFDAHSVPNGVALLGNRVTKEQAYLLRNKKPIMLPDRKGSYFFNDARRYGWRMAIPLWNYKDANEASMDIGTLEVAKRLHGAVFEDLKIAEIYYKFYGEN